MEDCEIAIFASALANFVVLVDTSTLELGEDITTQKIWLTNDQNAEVTSNHGRDARCNCAWAFGPSYVWVDAGKTEEVDILELSNEGENLLRKGSGTSVIRHRDSWPGFLTTGKTPSRPRLV
mmetsp:Transcript_8763/g.21464  ORF Transcript_8763/g.21464 Transcript_8763/m.21464 type:complete len:122 (+) Transcript_8763:862-1227(+)